MATQRILTRWHRPPQKRVFHSAPEESITTGLQAKRTEAPHAPTVEQMRFARCRLSTGR